MSLPYRPDLWHDPKTGKSTPHRAALSYLYTLVQEGCSDYEAVHELASRFQFLSSLWDAYLFVIRNRWRAERYLHQHDRIRASKDNNFKGVLAALKRAGTAKASDLKVIGQGRGGKHATYLSTICIERHLRKARKEGLVTVDRYGMWRLTEQVDLQTAIKIPSSSTLFNERGVSYIKPVRIDRHIPNDLQTFSDNSLTGRYCSLESMSDNQSPLEFDPRVLDRSLTDRVQDNTLTNDQYRVFKRWMIDDHSSRWFSDWKLFGSSMTDDHRLLMTDTDDDLSRSFDGDEEDDVQHMRE